VEGIGIYHFVTVSVIIFSLGWFCVLTRRNAIGILLGIELILNAANINFVAFAHFSDRPLDGQIFTIFIIMLAAAEAAIGLAVILGIYRNFGLTDVEQTRRLRL